MKARQQPQSAADGSVSVLLFRQEGYTEDRLREPYERLCLGVRPAAQCQRQTPIQGAASELFGNRFCEQYPAHFCAGGQPGVPGPRKSTSSRDIIWTSLSTATKAYVSARVYGWTTDITHGD